MRYIKITGNPNYKETWKAINICDWNDIPFITNFTNDDVCVYVIYEDDSEEYIGSYHDLISYIVKPLL